MKIVNLHAAKTQLSRLVSEVAEGKEIVIARAGTPVAKLVPVTGLASARRPGSMKGRIRIGRSFDAPLPADVADALGVK